MADDVSSILKSIQNARNSGATSGDIQDLSKRINDLTKAMDPKTTARGVLRDVHTRMQGTIIPTKSAVVSAAASASPTFAAIRSLWLQQKDYRNQVGNQISGIKNDEVKTLNDELRKLTTEVAKGETKPKPEVQASPKFDELEKSVSKTVDLQGELLKVNINQLDTLMELYKVWNGEDSPIVQAIQAESAQSQEFYRTFLEQQSADSLAGTETPVVIPPSDGGQGVKPTKSDPKSDSILGGIMGSLTGAGFSLTGLSGIFTTMSKLIKPIGKVAKILKVGPLALITSLYEFGDGFFNAEEVLNKGSVTIGERVQAGVTQLIGSFGGLFDMVAGWLGFDTNVETYLKDKVKIIMHYPAMVIDGAINVIKGVFEGISGDTKVTDIPMMMLRNIKDMIITGVDNLLNSDFIKNVADGAKELKGEMYKGVTDKFTSIVDSVQSFFSSMFDGFLEKIKSMVSFLPDWLGGEKVKKQLESIQESMNKSATVQVADNNSNVITRRINQTSAVENNRRQYEERQRTAQLQQQAASIQLNNQNVTSNTSNTSVIKTGISAVDPDQTSYLMNRSALGIY